MINHAQTEYVDGKTEINTNKQKRFRSYLDGSLRNSQNVSIKYLANIFVIAVNTLRVFWQSLYC